MRRFMECTARIVRAVGYVVAGGTLILGSYWSQIPERLMIMAVGMLAMIILGEVWDVTGRKSR